jgi:CDP-diacylglycerol--glycerol-3-phosphate 3-phosphatidyltransferase
VFALACDHRLARRLDRASLWQYSAFGAFLDPVADKLSGGGAGADRAAPPHDVDGACAAVIIGREITISALREWMAEIGQRPRCGRTVGKIKTIVQMVALSMLLVPRSPVRPPDLRDRRGLAGDRGAS